MAHLIDLAYLLGLAVAAPFWLVFPKARKKVFEALRERMGREPDDGSGSAGQVRKNARPASSKSDAVVHLHAVSLGELNATRTLAGELLVRRGDLKLVITVTTLTGMARARELYGSDPRVTVERFPLDFSFAIERFLRRHRPEVSVLMELELWPNFLRLCRRHEIPVVLVNGRLSAHSMKRYALIRPVARRMMRALHALCVQDETYAGRFAALGAPPERIVVTGTMKFDTASLPLDIRQVDALREAMGLLAEEALVVAGSTGPGEEEMLLRTYRELLTDHAALRLAIIPRKPERFEDVAELIARAGFEVRRRSQTRLSASVADGLNSEPGNSRPGPVLLGDTIGELRHFYALATVVVVGRSLVDLGPKLHGSDMIEPAALGKPVIVGPHTGNFADAMHLLRKHQAVVEVQDQTRLVAELRRLLDHEEDRTRLGAAALVTLEHGKGATARHADQILNLLPAVSALGK